MSIPVAQPLSTKISDDPIGEIFESLPITSMHWTIVGTAAAAYTSDAFDTYLVGFAMPIIARQWALSPVAVGSLASSGMWGMFLGAIAFGPLADRFGRKRTLAASILGFSLITGATSLAGSALQFLALRFATGLFLGGMLPVASVMVAEQFAARDRGKFVALPPVFWPIGLFLAAGASSLLVPRYGWPGLFLAGAFPVLLSGFVLTKLPESARWLMSRGEPLRAAGQLRRLGATQSQVEGLEGRQCGVRTNGSALLLRPPYRRRLVLTVSVLFFGFFGYYGFLLWLPSILSIRFGIGVVESFRYTALVGVFSILGKLMAVSTIDRWGRKPVLYFGYGLGGVASLAFGLLRSPLSLLAGASALSFLLEEAAAGCVVLPTELFPSQVRGTANSWTSAAGKLAAALSPIAFGFLLGKQMYYAVFVTMTIFFWCASLSVFLLQTDPAGKTLEEIGAS